VLRNNLIENHNIAKRLAKNAKNMRTVDLKEVEIAMNSRIRMKLLAATDQGVNQSRKGAIHLWSRLARKKLSASSTVSR
jgi:hypothetical protein